MVTGITGYLGSVIVKQLLDAGYRVWGTMWNHKDEKKVANIRKAYGDLFDWIELMSMDLNDPVSIIKAT